LSLYNAYLTTFTVLNGVMCLVGISLWGVKDPHWIRITGIFRSGINAPPIEPVIPQADDVAEEKEPKE
jgi:hypothetical protein